MPSDKNRIIVAVTGGIAAYKTPDIISALKKTGQWGSVEVMQTPSSTNFVTPATLKVMSDKYWEMDWGRTDHIDATENFGKDDMFLLVPATANTIAKVALGFGDNLVTDTALSLPNDVIKVFCPAMNTRMITNPIVQKNINTLKENGWHIIDPVEGLLACGTVGLGKLPSTGVIVGKIFGILSQTS